MNQQSKNNLLNNQEKITQKVLETIKDIKFGEVIIKIQDGKVIQIERLEKIRLSR